MRDYWIALAVGVVVGGIYGGLGVRSPAPPVVALIGLLGMLLGEQVVPLVKRVFAGETLTVSSVREQCGAHVFGPLPGRPPTAASPADPASPITPT